VRPSLTRRILILCSGTILVVVGASAGVVWVMMRHTLFENLDETLRTEALALAGRLEADEGWIEFEHAADGQEPSEPLVQIVDERGQVVYSSPALTDRRLLAERVSGGAASDPPEWFTRPLVSGGALHRFLEMFVSARTEEEEANERAVGEAPGAWVLVARPLAPVEQTLGQLGSVLAISVGVAAVAALLGGMVVARGGTRPVRILAERMGQVNPAHPELRLERARVPTELEPMVRTTETLLERVRGELDRQRQLTADVAHDLRTPVAGVRTLLEVCLQQERGAPEYVAAMEQAGEALRQLSRLLDDVLTLSRLDAGADEPVWEQVSLEEVLGAAATTVQPLATARGVTFQITPAPQAELRTDRGKLVKILSNLLCNAVEHSPAGEAVQLSVRPDVDTGGLEIAVADHGCGVPAELRGRIFDRFVRGDAARAGGDGHHGLGLPIAAGLARLLGGQLMLDERHKPGTRFVVRLPRGAGLACGRSR